MCNVNKKKRNSEKTIVSFYSLHCIETINYFKRLIFRNDLYDRIYTIVIKSLNIIPSYFISIKYFRCYNGPIYVRSSDQNRWQYISILSLSIDENGALIIDSILAYKLKGNKFLLSYFLRTNPEFPQPSWNISIIPTEYDRRKLIFFSHCLHSYIETNFYNVPKENLSQRSHRNVYVPIRISVTLWLCDVYRSKKIEEINLSVRPFVSSLLNRRNSRNTDIIYPTYFDV